MKQKKLLDFDETSRSKLAVRAKECRRKMQILELQAKLCEAGIDAQYYLEPHIDRFAIIYNGKMYFPSIEQARECLEEIGGITRIEV